MISQSNKIKIRPIGSEGRPFDLDGVAWASHAPRRRLIGAEQRRGGIYNVIAAL